MNIHEYQAKNLLKQYQVPVPEGRLVCGEPSRQHRQAGIDEIRQSAKEAATALQVERGNAVWVVKAQIHAGGRGKAGGVKLCRSIEAVGDTAAKLMGATLVTPQTGPKGKTIRRLWIEEGSDIADEFYLGVVIDRSTSSIVMMTSTEGGIEIEEVARKTPEKITKVAIDPVIGFKAFYGRKLAVALGLKPNSNYIRFFQGVYKLFVDKDCALVEINPLVLTKRGDLLALDAKVNFDDSALFRHPEIAELRDEHEEDPRDVEASKLGLSYVSLDGNIGCLVNGAGLAMATMDVIKLHGGEPANFLDVGGGASKETVANAFRLILEDSKVKAILVNIFGGIMRCDVIAEGIIAAAKELGVKVPLVVRLEGTNEELGKEVLSNSGLSITPADSITDAAEKVVTAARG